MANHRRSTVIGLAVCFGVVLAAPVAGFVGSGLLLTRSFGNVGGNVDPSRRATVLADGISASINASFAGFVVAAVALVPAVFFGVRFMLERRDAGASGQNGA